MPICVDAEVRRMNEAEFKARTYEVMRHIFAVHGELGRLFHEKIYHREIAFRVPDARCEVAVDVRFEDFCKTYYLDLLVGGGALFELKAVDALGEPQRRQLMQYLFLLDLPHGKLANLRPHRVDHEFVNNVLPRADRTAFNVVDDGWQELGEYRMREKMIAVLRDWGTGLDLALYEQAAACLCGQPPNVESDVEVRMGDRLLGVQRMRLASPEAAIRVTALAPEWLGDFRAHLCRVLAHTDLRVIQWINVTRSSLQFRTIKKGR